MVIPNLMCYYVNYLSKTNKEASMDIKEYFSQKSGKLSLKTQLAILIVSTFSIIIVAIIGFNYQRNSKTIITQQTSIISSLLKLETQNIDTYLSEIDRYSLLLRHEQSFMQIISNKQPLTFENTLIIQTLLRSNFDSRNDLLSYRLYLINKDNNYGINSKQHKVQSFTYDAFNELPHYEDFTSGKYYKYTLPSIESNAFMVYYRTIINIETKEPLAIVELTFDNSYIESLSYAHDGNNELFGYIDDKNHLFYTNNDQLISQATLYENSERFSDSTLQDNITTIDNNDYLAVYNTSEEYDYTLFNFKPLFEVDKQLSETRNISFILGFVSIIITTLLAILLIRVVTTPLYMLSNRLRGVGSGNFTTTIDVGGSSEISNLADDFNMMIFKIDDLINKTYKSELNEKTARLIALEAQINPHFLYNTLQAISAEAIVNHQPKINYMVTALASMMRYSIKGGDFVKLSQEMKHVNDYLLLQQARFEDNLTVTLHIDETTHNYFIPKISIQALVENSIIHGMKGQNDSIHIEISSFQKDELIIITVEDNGDGISKEKLLQLEEAFEKNRIEKSTTTSIGLVNLNSRLKLLYVNKASLTIQSQKNLSTKVTLSIPKYKEIPNV